MTRRTRLLAVALAVVQVVVLGVASSTAARRWVAAPLDDGDAYVLLVLGSDEGPPRGGSARSGRADGFHLLVVDARRTHVSILSFPRDSWVEVPGLGRTKINASLTRGPEAAVATAEGVTGLRVDDWILTGFHGLIAAVDELGGVTVDVEQRLYDPVGASSDLQPGTQVLDGWQALTYVRDRKSRPDGDIGRTASHARLLQSAHRQVRADGADAADVMRLVSLVRRHAETSVPAGRMVRLTALALTIPPEQVVRRVVPGQVGSAGAASVIHLTPAAEALFAQLRETGRLDGGDDQP
ncbi:MAG: LCP family protein [Actinobacteria bacterium]|nr:LCP family protein [Actinomycetota bacterium]